MSLLEVSRLSVRTADGDALVDDLSFSLDAGRRLGLIGESGSASPSPPSPSQGCSARVSRRPARCSSTASR